MNRNMINIFACAALVGLAPLAAQHEHQHDHGKKPAVEPGEVTLTTHSKGKLGPYLADENGRALYLLEEEPRNQSSCYGHCAEMWPPLLVEGNAVEAADPKIQEDLIGTIERRDGTKQVTYNGHALYYYVKDRRPGKVTGHDFTDEWGEWYLVTPEGEHLEMHGHKENKQEGRKSS